MKEDTIYKINGVNGPVITVTGGRGLQKMSLVYVGDQRLPGEVVSTNETTSVVQVYEDSAGLYAGEPVFPTGRPLSVMLGPGMSRSVLATTIRAPFSFRSEMISMED